MNSPQNLPIAPSELIINERGAIYHLDLRPEEIAHTIITVGDPGRVGGVSKHFDKITHKAAHREFVTHTGYIGALPISVVSTGIGPDNIDIVLNELDALVNIDFETRTIKDDKTSLSIMRLGTSGGLQEDVPVDSFVVSTHGLGLDNLMHYYGFSNTEEEQVTLEDFNSQTGLGKINIVPYICGGSAELLASFSEGFVKGITATCPGFYGPQGRMLRIPPAYNDLPGSLTGFRCGNHRIVNFEMETSAIYGLGRLLGHRCLSVSAVVANRVTKTFSKDGGLAVEKMIIRALEALVKG